MTAWDDNSKLVCSDGTEPSIDNCPNRTCISQHDKCAGDAKLYSLSRVNITVPPGSVPQCFQAAIGTKPGGVTVGNVGLDVLMSFGAPLVLLQLHVQILRLHILAQ